MGLTSQNTRYVCDSINSAGGAKFDCRSLLWDLIKPSKYCYCVKGEFLEGTPVDIPSVRRNEILYLNLQIL